MDISSDEEDALPSSLIPTSALSSPIRFTGIEGEEEGDEAVSNADETSVNTGLVSVARYLNMHARNGVPVANMDIAVVAHGPALKTLLSDEAYQTRYGIDNPNSELLEKLDAAGVDLYLCGQSMTFGGFEKSELASPVKVALSAMTMLTVLQSDGYALLR